MVAWAFLFSQVDQIRSKSWYPGVLVIKGKLSSGTGLSALNQLSAIHKKEPESFFKFKGIKKTFEIELTIIVFTVSFTTLPNFYPWMTWSRRQEI